ncbi:S24 family peptidase [Jejudonia soesokkakensis]|uniref:S24 family peptidase n=1 Tax=Jejudonia soesokkakensis TaxID=1323432 RepID=A0ABW2MTN6_9FLAO
MEIRLSGKIKKVDSRHAPEVSKQTGFPSAATHYTETPIDLHKELSINKDATFYIRVDDNAWADYNILKNDVLIIDRAIRSRFNDLALVVQEGEFKILRIPFDKEQETFTLWGVISYIIHAVR